MQARRAAQDWNRAWARVRINTRSQEIPPQLLSQQIQEHISISFLSPNSILGLKFLIVERMAVGSAVRQRWYLPQPGKQHCWRCR